MAVTLREVAKRAGVSAATVSHVLSGRAGYADQTRRRVLHSAETLGYRPHAGARAIRRGRFGAIGIITSSDRQHNETAIFLDGVQSALEGTGLNLVLARLPDDQLEAGVGLPRLVEELTVDGVLISVTPPVPTGLVDAVRRHAIPAVWLNNKIEGDSVAYDNIAAGREAVARLAALGHRRIAYLDAHWIERPDWRRYGQDDRLAGYRAGITEAGLEETVWRMEDGARRPRALSADLAARLKAADAPTAVIGRASVEGRALCGAAMLAKVRVPQDLSILAFVRSGLTTDTGAEISGITTPASDLAREAVTLLRKRMANAGGEIARDPSAGPRLVPMPFVDGETMGRIEIEAR